MGTESHPTAQRKAASSGTRAKFDAVWRDLRAECQDRRRINFGLAANIVGFAKFPVGWSWTECPLKPNTWRPAAFPKAEALGRLDTPSDGRSTPDGMRAFRRGAAFRLKAAERELCQLIMTQAIPAWLTDRNGDTREISNEIRFHHGLFVDSRRNGIGFQDLDWFGETDALCLVDAIDVRGGWKRKTSKNDWLLIERIARERVEAAGLPATQAQLHDAVLEILVAVAPMASAPHRTEVLELLASLMVEYGQSEN